ncbi:MAG: hypothetical protein JNK82_02575 [Myxococcaceae bacterium]|nr:hypothetical protein [Myxococcaceae bacterium]
MPRDEADAEDPNELVGVTLPASAADEAQMAVCIVEEFLRMGMTPEQVLRLFRSPSYRLTHALYARRGEAWIVRLVSSVEADWRARTCRT